MDKLLKTNTVVSIKRKDLNRYLTASRDGALVLWTQFGEYGWSERKAQWRVKWLEGPSMVEPGILAGDLNLWGIYNKALALADYFHSKFFIQTDRPPPPSEGGCRLELRNIRNSGAGHIFPGGVEFDGTLTVRRIVENKCQHVIAIEVTLSIVEIIPSKSPNYNNAELYSRGASPFGLTNSSLPGWQVGQMIFGAGDKTLSSPAAYFPRSFNSGGNVNYSGKQTNGDVRDADAIEY